MRITLRANPVLGSRPIVGQTTLVTSNLDRQGKINKVEYFAIGKDSVLVNVNARNTQLVISQVVVTPLIPSISR